MGKSPRRALRSLLFVILNAFLSLSRTAPVLAVAFIILTATANAVPMFMGLGDLPGGAFDSQPFAISGDGKVVVGTATSADGGKAFRWTSQGGIQDLGIKGDALGVSADGSVVVGAKFNQGAAFRWTQTSGALDLPSIALTQIGANSGRAQGISADGNVVVGSSFCGSGGPLTRCDQAVRWTQVGGINDLGLLPASFPFSGRFQQRALGISSDASTIVGFSNMNVSENLSAIRWTEATGLQRLDKGSFTTGENTVAAAVSANGGVIIGTGSGASISEAFRWNQSSAMVGLGDLPGGLLSSKATALSADGSIIVGSGNANGVGKAFIWDQSRGMRDLQNVLVSDFGLGAALSGWTLVNATGISADGKTIVGSGTNPFGQTEAWIAGLSARVLPDPLTDLKKLKQAVDRFLSRAPEIPATKTALELSVAALSHQAILVTVPAIGGPVVVSLGALEASIQGFFAIYNIVRLTAISIDPPDPNTQFIFQPRSYAFSAIPASIVRPLLDLASMLEALQVTADRYAQAVRDGDLGAAEKQRQALSTYLNRTIRLASDASVTLESLLNAIQGANVNNLGVSKNQVLAFQQELSLLGFSDFERDIFESLGLNEDQISSILNSFVSEDFSQIDPFLSTTQLFSEASSILRELSTFLADARVPEPSTWLLLMAGLLIIAMTHKRHTTQPNPCTIYEQRENSNIVLRVYRVIDSQRYSRKFSWW